MKTKLVLCLAIGGAYAALGLACSDDDSNPATTKDAGADRTAADTGTNADTGGGSDGANEATVDAGDRCKTINISASPVGRGSTGATVNNRFTFRFTPNVGELPPDGSIIPFDRFYIDLWDTSIPLNQPRSLTGANAQGTSCKECLWVYQDFNPSDFSTATYYLAHAGTITVNELTGADGGVATMKVTLNDVRLDQVALTSVDPQSATTDVADGGCLRVASPVTLQFPAPVPDAGSSDAASDAPSDAPDGG